MTGRRKPTHPGTVLKYDVLEPLGLSVTEAARRLGVTRKTLSELINARASTSPEMAVRVARATNTTPESRLTMQTRLDLWQDEQRTPPVQKLEPANT